MEDRKFASIDRRNRIETSSYVRQVNRSKSAAIRVAPLEFAYVHLCIVLRIQWYACPYSGIRINAADSRRNYKGVNASYTEQYTSSPTFRKGMPRNLTRDSDSCPSPDGPIKTNVSREFPFQSTIDTADSRIEVHCYYLRSNLREIIN